MQSRLAPKRSPLVPLAATGACTTVAGALAVRWLGLSWPDLALAAMVAVAAIMLLLWAAPRLPTTGAAPGLPAPGAALRLPAPVVTRAALWSGPAPDWRAALPTLYCVAGAVFLLPLIDPRLRSSGTAPAAWQVVLSAVPLIARVVGRDFVLSLGWGQQWRGTLALRSGGIAGGVLTGCGYLLSLGAPLGRPAALTAGIWVGAVGFLVAGSGFIYWVLTGMAALPTWQERQVVTPARCTATRGAQPRRYSTGRPVAQERGR
jgi:hypothetical protein